MKLVSYLRVSTKDQVDGYGLASQRQDVQRWTKKHGHRIVQECRDEGVSGTLDALDREGLTCALNAIEAGVAEAVVIPKLDRLARRLHVQEAALAHVWQLGGSVFTVESGEVLQDDPDDPMRTAMRQMMGVFAQLDRSMIVQRMRKGRAAKQAAGGYAAGRPGLGYRAEGGSLVVDEREHHTLATILSMHADGLSTRQIAERLNESDEHQPKRSDQFYSSTISRIIRRNTHA